MTPEVPATSISEPGSSSMYPRLAVRLTVPPFKTLPVRCPELFE